MARSPLARPTDAPPSAHEPAAIVAEPPPTAAPAPADPAAEAQDLPADDLPRHVAIIMDGNRRWARQRDLPELEGHAAGVEAIREILRHAVRRGVPVLTLYAFSRENWARSDDEVTGLFELLEGAIRSETDELIRQGVRVRLLGRLDELPDATRESIGDALDATSDGTRLLLNIAFNYAGRTELVDAVRRGVPVLTLYAFSRENWARSDDEVTGLFELLEGAIRSETDELIRQGVRVRLLGRLDELPVATRESIGEALDATSDGTRLLLNIAFNYAGRTELVDAVRRLVAAGQPPESIDEAAVTAALYTAGLPDPDLLIRTGGEQRLSNFLIWQSAYAEFYFCEALWPDFGPAAFDEALLEFARRQRRFGR